MSLYKGTRDVKRIKLEITENQTEKREELDLQSYEKLYITDEEISYLDEVKEEKVETTKRRPYLPPPFHCIECFAYMGEMNSRQYCNKRNCYYDYYDEEEMLQQQVFNLRTSPYYDDPSFYEYNEYHNVIQEFIDNNHIESVSYFDKNPKDGSS